jgi:hypothetical protein
MHRDTFDDFLADVRAAEDEWDRQLTERMGELVERKRDDRRLVSRIHLTNSG